MWLLKACPRCGGDLVYHERPRYLDSEHVEDSGYRCLQCGRSVEPTPAPRIDHGRGQGRHQRRGAA